MWYERDASWWKNPNTSTPKKLHLRKNSEIFALCGNIMLITDTSEEKPPESRKCKRCLKIAK